MKHISGVSKGGGGGLRVLEHPPQLWHNSQISSSVATLYADNQQLVARTNNELKIHFVAKQRFGRCGLKFSTSLLQILDTPLHI